MNSRRSARPNIARRMKRCSARARTRIVGNATFGLTLGYFERDDRIDSPGVAPGIRDPFGVPPNLVDSNLTRYSATFTGTQKFSDMVTLAYGVDWLRETGTSDGSLDFGGGFVLPTSFDLTRTTWAPFAEMRVETKFGISTQLGVRVDDPDGASSVTSPRVRVAYDTGRIGIHHRGRVGQGIQAAEFLCARTSAGRQSGPGAGTRRVVRARVVAGNPRWRGTPERDVFRRRIPQRDRLRSGSAADAREPQSRGHRGLRARGPRGP